MTQPRIATFARLANGNLEPKRVIEGQASKLGRTLHGIDYNAVRDEIVATNPLAAAVLVFRGGAKGEEAPIRIIQGPKTKMVFPHTAISDSVNKEIIVTDAHGSRILVYAEEAQGDVAPIRVIEGPKTRLGYIGPAAVDIQRNLLVVSNRPPGGQDLGLFIYNRTDAGDVAPRGIISGPKTGIGFPWQVQLHEGRIFVSLINTPYYPMYSLDGINIKLRDGIKPDAEIKSPWTSDTLGFVAVWEITDRGDVAPRAVIKGPLSGLIHPGGLAINPKAGELYVTDSVRNGLYTYLVPDFFRNTP